MVSTRATAATAAEDPKVTGARRSKIKTYTRRRLTRRMSSPLLPKTEYNNEEPRPTPPRLTQRSFSELVTSQQQQPITPIKKRHAQQQQPDFAVPGPKRARCMLTADEIQQTPTELFFKMISASAPELLQPHQKEEEEVVFLSTEVDDDVLQEEENPPVEPVSLSNDKIKAEADEQVEVDKPEEQAVEAESEGLIAEDEGDNDGMPALIAQHLSWGLSEIDLGSY